jgi:rhodanese-related sulfurtransferase
VPRVKDVRDVGCRMPNTIDELLAEARRHLDRVSPPAAAAAMDNGALLVDIRPLEQRRRQGEVPGALVVGRNVLEWRLDPAGPHRIPEANRIGSPVIVFCAQGYASSLAARSLQTLGWDGATDLIGGFDAWVAAGLPVRPCAGPTADEAGATRRRDSAGEEAVDQTG